MHSFFSSVLITVVLAILLRFFVIQPFIVDGESMEPNFSNQQYIMIDKLSYRFRDPGRGEVVVFHPPTNPTENYIKRVIGLPGETVKIENNEVVVNGHVVNETYLGSRQHATQNFSSMPPVTLGDDEYFVLGDNRPHSSDSREWGPLKKAAIEGRTWFVIFPVNAFHTVTKPSYDFSFFGAQLTLS